MKKEELDVIDFNEEMDTCEEGSQENEAYDVPDTMYKDVIYEDALHEDAMHEDAMREDVMYEDTLNEEEFAEAYEEEEDWKEELVSTIKTILFTVVLVVILKTFIIINATVPTGSMENTIMPGDNILGLRIAYMLEEPERGDVIFFYFPDDESQKYVKRVIGLPGEKVVIEDGKIYINDSTEPLEEPYLKEEWRISTGPYEFYVPEDCYLMLGDNRNTSADARMWKNSYVAKEKIIGKAIFTYYPFDRWGFVK